MRWVGWRRTRGTDQDLDASLERRESTKIHAVEGRVGGYADTGNGQEGRAVCGTKVPEDDPDLILWWVTGPVPGLNKHCKRCLRKIARCKKDS